MRPAPLQGRTVPATVQGRARGKGLCPAPSEVAERLRRAGVQSVEIQVNCPPRQGASDAANHGQEGAHVPGGDYARRFERRGRQRPNRRPRRQRVWWSWKNLSTRHGEASCMTLQSQECLGVLRQPNNLWATLRRGLSGGAGPDSTQGRPRGLRSVVCECPEPAYASRKLRGAMLSCALADAGWPAREACRTRRIAQGSLTCGHSRQGLDLRQLK